MTAYPATCPASGTFNFQRVGYGSLARHVCFHCGVRVSLKVDGTVRKHPVGGKAGILRTPAGANP